MVIALHLQHRLVSLKLFACNHSEKYCAMEQLLPEDHPDMIRIVQAAHHDIKPLAEKKGQSNSLANALAMALGNPAGGDDDLENIEFLVHVLSVNRASGAIEDDAFERLLQQIKTKEGRANLATRLTQELEAEHGYEDEE